jgi:hypothetical protein
VTSREEHKHRSSIYDNGPSNALSSRCPLGAKRASSVTYEATTFSISEVSITGSMESDDGQRQQAPAISLY